VPVWIEAEPPLARPPRPVLYKTLRGRETRVTLGFHDGHRAQGRSGHAIHKDPDMETTQGSTPIDSKTNSQSNSAPNDGGNDHPNRGCRDHGRHGRGRGRFLFALVIVLAAGVAGGFIGKSFAHGHSFMSLSSDPAKRDAQVEHGVKRFASRVDATPEQQQKLIAIAKDAAKDIVPMREKLRSAGKQALEITSAPTIDRAAMERLRAEQVALADSVSKRITQALADAADVLTPEQRQKVAGRLNERMEHHEGGWGYFRG
jgi:protein CpxP